MITTLIQKRQSPHMILVGSLRDQDPTRTVTIRNRFVADVTRRFKTVINSIKETIVTNDYFKLNKSLKTHSEALEDKESSFLSDSEKITAFLLWLSVLMSEEVLTHSFSFSYGRNQLWTDAYIYNMYERGLKQARIDLIQSGINVPEITKLSTSNLGQLDLIYLRMSELLNGVVEVTKAQIADTLTQGLIEKISNDELYTLIIDRIEKVGITRASMNVRTEAVRAFNTATLKEFSDVADSFNVVVLVQWWTALDEKVCGLCGPRHGKVYEINFALSLISPHKNCRCGLLPYIRE